VPPDLVFRSRKHRRHVSVVSLRCFLRDLKGQTCVYGAVGDPPCSFALAPSDLHLFGTLKKHLAGKLFPTDTDVKQAVT